MTAIDSELREPVGLRIHVVRPVGLSCTKLDELACLIVEGGQIRPDNIADRLLRCRWIAYATDNEKVVGVAALKTPHDGPDDNAFYKAKSPYNYDAFTMEIGFLMIASPYRRKHLALALTKTLCDLESRSNLYATVVEANCGAQSVLLRNGFVQSGVPFADRGGSEPLVLWVKVPT